MFIVQRMLRLCHRFSRRIACLWCFAALLFSALLFSVQAFAAFPPVTQVKLSSDVQYVDMQYFIDRSNALTLEDVQQTPVSWSALEQKHADFGYESDAIWYRFSLQNALTEQVKTFLEIDFPILDFVDFYLFDKDGLVSTISTGDRVPYTQRQIDNPRFIFPIFVPAGEAQTIYLRVQTSGSHIVPIELWSDDALIEHIGRDRSMLGLYFGTSITIVFFFLMIYVGLRAPVYLYYSLALSSILVFTAQMRGVFYAYVLPASPDFHHALLLFSMTGMPIFGSLFVRNFLSLDTYSKSLSYGINVFVVAMLGCVFAWLFLDFQSWLKLTMGVLILTVPLVVMIGPVAIWKRCPNAWIFTIATFVFLIMAIFSILSRYGWVPFSFISEYGMMIGSAAQGIILSVALGYRVRQEHQDKLAAQNAQLEETTARISIETQLLKNSLTHAVSKLPNRSVYEDTLQDAILHRGEHRIAAAIIEVTRYTEISKTIGHHNTDLLIAELAQHFSQIISKVPGIINIDSSAFKTGSTGNTYVCSLENDSFGVLFNADIASENRNEMAEIIRELNQPIEFKQMTLELNVIVGVAVCPEHGKNAATLMRHAGVALDSSDAREFQFARFQPEQDQYNTRRLTMVSELKQAINEDQLELFLQPKYSPIKNKVVGAEALVRWNHHLYGMIRPDEFIAIAEKTGVIKALTRWVFRRALEQQKTLATQGHHLTVSINLSALNLREKDLAPFMEAELKAQDVDPRMIYIELTETAMMNHPQAAISKLEEIRALGLKVSIDDFGAGYSSLAYLQNLPANEIKIDRALVVAMSEENSSNTVVRSTVDMCHELGFSVVAEGVETTEMQNKLTDLGCDLIQGYLFTPPLPQDQFINWLNNANTERFVS